VLEELQAERAVNLVVVVVVLVVMVEPQAVLVVM
jgi:hypothetical protein